MTTDTRSPEENNTALVATAMMSKRADGHIEVLTASDAANLLGCIDSYNTGQGAFNLLVPTQKIRELGLNEQLWSDVSSPRVNDGRSSYDVDYMTGVELIGRLEVLSGKKWNDVKALKQTIDASRGDKKIG